MRTVRLEKPYKRFRVGDIIEVENNEAHNLIDSGKAHLVQSGFIANARNRMLTPGKNKKVKLK